MANKILPRPLYIKGDGSMVLPKASPQVYVYDVNAATATTVADGSLVTTQPATFAGGTTTGFVNQGSNFVAQSAQATYYITARGTTVTLLPTDPIGTTYEFIDMSGDLVDGGNHVIQTSPGSLQTINGGDFVRIMNNYQHSFVTKISATAWLAANTEAGSFWVQ